MVVAYWLLDVEDNRVVVYWQLQGARQALEDVLRKLGPRLPEDVRLVIEAALNDIREQLWGLEGELTTIITLPTNWPGETSGASNQKERAETGDTS